MKFMTFLRAADRASRLRFQQALVDRFAPQFMAANPHMSKFVVNVVDRTPARLPYLPVSTAGSPTNADHEPPYDAILQTWFSSQDEFLRATGRWSGELSSELAATHRYAVTQTTIWSHKVEATGRLPGVRYLSLLEFHDDLPESAIRRSWAHHVNLARRAHPNAVQYLQNWIDRRLDPSAPPAGGMSELYFATEREAFEQFFDSDRGRDEITHETKHFVKAGPRFYTSEHVFNPG